MASFAEIREALRAALADVFEPDVTVTAYMKKNPGPRHMQVMGPDQIEYDLAMQRGLDRWTLVIQAFAGSPEEKAAQARLDTWLAGSGATSVKAAVEADQTLGGVVTAARVSRSSGYREYDLSNRGDRTLGAEFFVDVFTEH